MLSGTAEKYYKRQEVASIMNAAPHRTAPHGRAIIFK
jgi:hypothetical protein